MKRIFFFLILPFFVINAVIAADRTLMPDPVTVLDSTDLFHNITNISKQVQERAARSDSPQEQELIKLEPAMVTMDSVPVGEVVDSLTPTVRSGRIDSIVPIMPSLIVR